MPLTTSRADLPYVVPAEARNADGITRLATEHPNIRFVSLLAVDLGGNETDERIPIPRKVRDAAEMLEGGVQTDGSSVALPGIATLNNAKVDLVADTEARWYIDYNEDNIDAATGLPVGTLMIPAFLRHENLWVDSRSVLRRAEAYIDSRLRELLRDDPRAARSLGLRPRQIERVVPTTATELEFWVRTPGAQAEVERLSVSQALQEQYWKPTRGAVRTGLERSLELLRRYGLEPEMGHKEVGGVNARVAGSGAADIMEQIEIDWRFSTALQAADNELLARTMIDRAFAGLGLEVTFQAKPIEGVAGNGEHTHVGMAAQVQGGGTRNLFAPARMDQDFLSEIGWGAIMGLLKHWEVVGPFVTCSTDAFNRLKPGFEAPVCIVTSLGHNVGLPSRNRSVLAGLVRDLDNPHATRFEVRAPNPHTNSYLAMAAIYLAMVDGITHAIRSGASTKDLEKECSKAPGEPATYLRADRAYRSEEDVFEHFTQEERDRLFGRPPATVGETLATLESTEGREDLLCAGGVFTPAIISSYGAAMRAKWRLELTQRIIPANIAVVRGLRRLHGADAEAVDERAWDDIQSLRLELMKDTTARPSLFTRIREAVAAGDDTTTSALQLAMNAKMAEAQDRYAAYARNLLDIAPADASDLTNGYRLAPTAMVAAP
ncbi:MAG: glutamine synthetase [Dehalococcoidia bacterium]